MKKETFIKSAMISTLCIVLSKTLGIIYVIPFHAIIGPKGRTLYGYAYNMYMLFLQFSTVGIPLAISKIVSEYNSLGYNDAKKRTYKIALIATFVTALISTVILFTGAPLIANTIIGDMQGGSSKQDIIFVLRIASTAILFVTILSSMRGYLQGHKYISVSSISQVIEQFVRVIIIIFGSFVAVKLFGVREAVAIAILGATIGAIVALFYLKHKMKKLNIENKNDTTISFQEKKLTNKILIKQLINYTIPFILVSIAVSLYNTTDMLSIVKPLVNYGGLTLQNAENVLSTISTWGAKLNSIVTSVASGVVVAVLPNVTSAYVDKNKKEVNDKVNKTIQMITYIIIPMVIGLSFLAEPVWTIFYGKSFLGTSVFKYSIFTSIFYSLFLNIYTIMQSINHHKTANISIFLGLLSKVVLTVPLIVLFSKTSFIPAYYGSITATIIAYIIPIVICLIDLRKNADICFKDTTKKVILSIFSCIVMIIVLSLLKIVYPISGDLIYSVIAVVVYSIVGTISYLLVSNKFNLFEDIFGCKIKTFIKKIINKKGGKI